MGKMARVVVVRVVVTVTEAQRYNVPIPMTSALEVANLIFPSSLAAADWLGKNGKRGIVSDAWYWGTQETFPWWVWLSRS